MRRALFVGLVSFLAVITPCEAQTIFLVRHAERADADGVAQKDPELSAAGKRRAQALAATLRDAKIGAIYVTEFKRTQETAKPLAEKLAIEPIVVPARETAQLVAKLKAGTGPALVVAHSNTLPDILKALGIASPPSIGESDYGDLFVFECGSSPQVVRLHYR
jgi:phosphohistidine phosphatase SixA